MARAKRTDRAEARRRYRTEQASTADTPAEDEDESPPARPTPPSRRTNVDRPAPSTPRPSALSAFRMAYQPADVRADLRALPELIRSRAVLLPALGVLVSSIVYAIAVGDASAQPLVPTESPSPSVVASANPSASPSIVVTPAPTASGSAAASAAASPGASGTGSSGTAGGGTILGFIASILALLFLEIPPIGGVYLGAILAKRASYLAGAIAGFLGPLGLIVAILATASDKSIITFGLAFQIVFESTIFGLLIGAGLGYYRRLLRLMGPGPAKAPASRSSAADRSRSTRRR